MLAKVILRSKNVKINTSMQIKKVIKEPTKLKRHINTYVNEETKRKGYEKGKKQLQLPQLQF